VTFQPVTVGSAPPVAATSAASLLGGPLAAGSIATLWSTGLPAGPVSVADANGVSRPAQVFYTSPSQIDFQIPPGTPPGPATIKVVSPDGNSASANAAIASVSPGIFQMNATDLAAAYVVRVMADQSQKIGAVYQVDASNNVTPLPLSVAPANGAVYLAVFGTGFHNAHNIAATVGSQAVPVTWFDPKGTATGLDQVNIGPLPISLAGWGRVNIIVTADGQTANPVEVYIQ